MDPTYSRRIAAIAGHLSGELRKSPECLDVQRDAQVYETALLYGEGALSGNLTVDSNPPRYAKASQASLDPVGPVGPLAKVPAQSKNTAKVAAPVPGVWTLFQGAKAGGWTPQLDTVESDAGFLVSAALPGARPESVRVGVKDSGRLVVSGKRVRGTALASAHGSADRRGLLERKYAVGPFSASWQLPVDADLESVAAHLHKDVLHLTMRRRKETGPPANSSSGPTQGFNKRLPTLKIYRTA